MPSQCEASYHRDVKTIFATALQYPARSSVAMRQNDLPQEHKECDTQARRPRAACTSRFRGRLRGTVQPDLPSKQIVRVLTSSVESPLGNDVLRARYFIGGGAALRQGNILRDLDLTGAANPNVRCLADTAPFGSITAHRLLQHRRRDGPSSLSLRTAHRRHCSRDGCAPWLPSG